MIFYCLLLLPTLFNLKCKEKIVDKEVFDLNMENMVFNIFCLIVLTTEVMYCHLAIEKPELNFNYILFHFP